MKKMSLAAKAGTGAAALALTAACVAGRAWAFNPQPDPPGISGLVGIVEGQTARLNVVNVTTVPMHAVLNFLDGDGSVRKQLVVTLRPGQGTHLDVTRAELITRTDTDGGGAGRSETYAEVVLLPAVRQALPPDPYRPSLEVFSNADGVTRVLDTNFHNPPADHNPPGD